MAASSGPGRETVEAAQRGDARAQDELVAAYLPLVYNIVGRALNGHPDVDDVVQETVLRALAALGSLNDPAGFRSWLVAITMNQLRHHWREHRTAPAGTTLHDAYDVADPGADFVDLTIVRLGLEGQRREAAEATRWLDPDDQALLSLWWLEAAGELTRAEVAAALELSPRHTAVRVQRMKARLETARLVVRALSAQPRCVLLDDVVASWDAAPSALWRKRIARHARDCTVCAGLQSGLVPAEGLLAALGLVPVGASLLAASALLTAFGAGTADAAPVSFAGDATGTGAEHDGSGTTPGPGGGPEAAFTGPTGQDGVWGGPGGGPEAAFTGPTGQDGVWGGAQAGPGGLSDGRAAAYGDAVGDPATADSPTGPPGPGPVVGHRTNLRARSRRRKRRGRTAAAVAAALLVTGGTTAGMAVLTPDGGGDRPRAVSEGAAESAVPATSEPAGPSTEPSSASPSLSSSPSAGASREPKPSATPGPDESEAKSAPARTSAPAKQPARPRPDQPSTPPAGDPAAQVLSLANTERAKAGCGPLKFDDRLARAARLHSEDMSANDYFSHTGRNGSSFADRAGAQGHPSPGAENIARGQSSAQSVMDAWMNSPGHRANILNCSLTTLGVGVVDSDWTWTQVFGY
ncbi:sigma-70 family RNA polymerase sigma factor [Streptomyces sp. NPDC059454]|uniref:sigma-70 family RNA polymerase sigma factor n=1 Tax=Streptomyces sp. NPDC059454 TaxID=3346836 RepID=UPI00369F79C1